MDPEKAYNILCIKGHGKVKLCSKAILHHVYESYEIYGEKNYILLL